VLLLTLDKASEDLFQKTGRPPEACLFVCLIGVFLVTLISIGKTIRKYNDWKNLEIRSGER
jgi:hypothetical protein